MVQLFTMSLLSIFANSILPIFIMAGIGFWLARFKHTDPKTVSAITFNVLSPSLIFYTLVTAKISMSDFRQMAVFTFAVIGAAGAISWVAARAMRLDRPETSAFLVVSMFFLNAPESYRTKK